MLNEEQSPIVGGFREDFRRLATLEGSSREAHCVVPTPIRIFLNPDVCAGRRLRLAASANLVLWLGLLLRICFLLSVLLAAQWTMATEPDDAGKRRTFYVRQTVGDDQNDGLSPNKAWRSVSMLGNALRAGDSAYVGPGLYREEVTLANGGTADAWITLTADTSGAYTGDPAGVVMVTGADPIDERLFVEQPTSGVFAAPSLEEPVLGIVEMDGPQYRYRSIRGTRAFLKDGVGASAVLAGLRSSFFYDRETKSVNIHTSDDKPPTAHEIEVIRRQSGIVTHGKKYVAVVGFTFRHMGLAGINFDLGSSHCAALHNTSYGAWQGIRVCSSTDVMVAENTLFRNSNCGVYFLSGSRHGYAVGNVLYENSKGIRWSSNSAHGMALHNTVFANHDTGIMIQNADGIRLSSNVLVNNAISQLSVRESRYGARGNCLETGDAEQLVAQIDIIGRYNTLLKYQQAVRQDLDSREQCGSLPKTTDVRRLHAESLAYAERARLRLVEDATKGSHPDALD
jgi:parallel beta-helix repeat protein